MKKNFPVELLELFEYQVQAAFPFGGYFPFVDELEEEFESTWKFNVHEGVGILKCSLRDVQGNEEDFEWELTLRGV